MTPTTPPTPADREAAVAQRYAAAAGAQEPALCCPVQYRREYLEVIPEEILQRDYGCGDPSQYVREGETVLDLGSGGGKICYILSQVVGPAGRVIGVDCNQEMLTLARRYREEVAGRIGHAKLEFRYGLIQDLALDLEQLAEQARGLALESPQDWIDLRQLEHRLRRESPMIPDASVDCVVSNCVLNLVRPEDRRQLFSEVFRVLALGGRAAISDIVADEDVPAHLQDDPDLWSGCISGAFREDRFLQAFEDAGFYGMRIASRQAEPWRTIEGIEFRSVTVVAYKGKQGPCRECNQAVIYRGPFKQVEDDDNVSMHEKSNDPNWLFTPEGQPRGYIESDALRELWFHTGTNCNLACPFCFEGSKPGNNRIEFLTLDDVRPFVAEAVELGVEKFSFTGGEPFVNPSFLDILDHALEHRPCFILTNGTKPLRNRMGKLLEFKAKPNPLAFRVSLDHPDPARHDESRGKGNFRMALRTLGLLHAEGFAVSIARLMEPDEDSEAVDRRYAPFFREAGLPPYLPVVKFPDFLLPGEIADVPNVTENCMTSYTSAPQRAEYMCGYSRLIVKQNGRCGVYACTLVDDDAQFDLGDTLRESLDVRIRLKHHRCYSCFAYGSSCSERPPACQPENAPDDDAPEGP